MHEGPATRLLGQVVLQLLQGRILRRELLENAVGNDVDEKSKQNGDTTESNEAAVISTALNAQAFIHSRSYPRRSNV